MRSQIRDRMSVSWYRHLRHVPPFVTIGVPHVYRPDACRRFVILRHPAGPSDQIESIGNNEQASKAARETQFCYFGPPGEQNALED